MRFQTFAEQQAEKDARARWQKDPALRAEFCDDVTSCVAYFKAEARGVTGNCGGGNVTGGKVDRAALAANPASLRSGSDAAQSRSSFRVNTADDEFREKMLKRWNANPGAGGHRDFESFFRSCVYDLAMGGDTNG